jgi:F-type H+-transporting ATPase subunit b
VTTVRTHLWTFVFQTINFLVLVWVLRRLLYRPIKLVIARRQQEIAASLAKGEADRTAVATERAELAKREAEAELERQRVVETGRQQVEAERTAFLAEIQKTAGEKEATARAALERERTAAVSALRAGAADLAVSLAERLLSGIGSMGTTLPLLDQALAALGGLDPREKDRIAVDLRGGQRLRVVTATPLPDDRRAACKASLRTVLGIDANVDFEEDLALLAGAEIHLPSAVIRQNWRDQLVRVRKELDANVAG